jgi:hypothetical protein
LTPKARNFFKALLESISNPDVVGIMLNYHQSSTGEPRMVFSFDFAKRNQLTDQDEGYAKTDVNHELLQRCAFLACVPIHSFMHS